MASSPQPPFTIAICGGGLGGLALAIGLLHQNIRVHVYEAAHAFAEVGAGVGFGVNSRRAMELIDERIKEGYQRRATENGWKEKKGTWFDFRVGGDFEEGRKLREAIQKAGVDGGEGRRGGRVFATVESREGEVGLSCVHRAHFLDELVKLVPKESASFGKKIEEIEELEDGVRLHFHDGTTAEASAVIGCDGIKSRTRQILLGSNDPAAHATFTGKYAYRGLVPMDKAVRLVGDELARNSQMYVGPHGHVLMFPIEKGKTINVVAFHGKPGEKWENEQWVLPMKMEDMMKDFEGWGDDVRKILSLMEHPDVWAIFHDPPARTYHRGRVCLLGDAAHASSPHQGAGAGMAMEDAYVLSNLMGMIHESKDIEKVFRAYDHVRRPRTQKLVSTSYDAGRLYDFEAPDIEDDLRKISQNLQERYKWVWDIDLKSHLEEAKSQLNIVG